MVRDGRRVRMVGRCMVDNGGRGVMEVSGVDGRSAVVQRRCEVQLSVLDGRKGTEPFTEWPNDFRRRAQTIGKMSSR